MVVLEFSAATVQAHFYCIRISALGEADMANMNQDSGLFAKTGKASMGECDAFISHSWRDDPALKWQRMLEFRAEFESKSERAPGTTMLARNLVVARTSVRVRPG